MDWNLSTKRFPETQKRCGAAFPGVRLRNTAQASPPSLRTQLNECAAAVCHFSCTNIWLIGQASTQTRFCMGFRRGEFMHGRTFHIQYSCTFYGRTCSAPTSAARDSVHWPQNNSEATTPQLRAPPGREWVGASGTAGRWQSSWLKSHFWRLHKLRMDPKGNWFLKTLKSSRTLLVQTNRPRSRLIEHSAISEERSYNNV